MDEPGVACCPLARRQRHADAAADNERLFLMSFVLVHLPVKILFARPKNGRNVRLLARVGIMRINFSAFSNMRNLQNSEENVLN